MRAPFKEILRQAEPPEDLRFHDLPHCCATLLIAQSSTTLEIYGHVLDDPLREARCGRGTARGWISS